MSTGLVLTLVLAGCERGCLARWIDARNDSGPLDPVGAVDCAPGLMRCSGGVLQRHTTPTTCAGCPCAWGVDSHRCARGCVAEGLELFRVADDATTLCALVDGEPSFVAAPPDAGAGTCPGEGERFVCRGGVVFACPGKEGVPVSLCLRGCVVEVEALDEGDVDIAKASAVLCRRGTSLRHP